MPGLLEIHFEGTRGGMTPAKSVLSWLEYGLGAATAHHAAHGLKPYAVKTAQRSAGLAARITLATPELLERAVALTRRRGHVLNGQEVEVTLRDACFLPAPQLFDEAPPWTQVRVTALTPVIYRSSGHDDPVLTKQRLFQSARDRWAAHETLPPPLLDSAADVELLKIRGRSAPFETGTLHRGWIGDLTLKLYGPPEQVRGINALLGYAALWGIGAKTALGAGGIHVEEARRG